VVVMTTPSADIDISRVYDLGRIRSSPNRWRSIHLVGVMKTIGEYWFRVVHAAREDLR